jgi:chromosome segregation ATPase
MAENFVTQQQLDLLEKNLRMSFAQTFKRHTEQINLIIPQLNECVVFVNEYKSKKQERERQEELDRKANERTLAEVTKIKQEQLKSLEEKDNLIGNMQEQLKSLEEKDNLIGNMQEQLKSLEEKDNLIGNMQEQLMQLQKELNKVKQAKEAGL